MKRKLTATERLIVAADFRPPSDLKKSISARSHVRDSVLKLADDLEGTGVYIKVNSAVRACGYGLIDELHARGLRVFVDLKLFDIKETLSIDGALLFETKPELLTVVCSAGVEAMEALKAELPDTEVLGVTVLTSHDENIAQAMFCCSVEEAAVRFANFGKSAGIDGLISSAKEATVLSAGFGVLFSINTPAIRPTWAIVKGDDQNPDRIMTPFKAIKAGADRIVVGRPIIQAEKPRDAVMRTIDEIMLATA